MKLQQLFMFTKVQPEFLRTDKVEKKGIGKADDI